MPKAATVCTSGASTMRLRVLSLHGRMKQKARETRLAAFTAASSGVSPCCLIHPRLEAVVSSEYAEGSHSVHVWSINCETQVSSLHGRMKQKARETRLAAFIAASSGVSPCCLIPLRLEAAVSSDYAEGSHRVHVWSINNETQGAQPARRMKQRARETRLAAFTAAISGTFQQSCGVKAFTPDWSCPASSLQDCMMHTARLPAACIMASSDDAKESSRPLETTQNQSC